MGLWMWAFDSFIYPGVLLGIICLGTLVSGQAIYQQRRRVTRALNQMRLVPFVRKGYVRAMLAKDLVPGDVVVVQQGLATCDMVILRGSCLIDDAMLLGEVQLSLAIKAALR